MKHSILIVEDDADTRRTLCELLKSLGFRVLTACDGLDGLKKVKAFRFNAILVDMKMPNMNGEEFHDAFRRDVCLVTPIIMMSALVPENRKKFDHFIAKPLNADTLMNKIESVLFSKGVTWEPSYA